LILLLNISGQSVTDASTQKQVEKLSKQQAKEVLVTALKVDFTHSLG